MSMSLAPSPSAPRPIAIRVDSDGFLTRVETKVRLQFGTDLYSAKANPGPSEKVMPFQPGYMKLVSALGGQLVCPPVVRDPATGEPRPNPQVETYPGTATIRRVTATAVCSVPNPATGEPVTSVQTIVYDAEHVLKQSMLKLAVNEKAVLVLSEDDVAAEREAGQLKGWTVLPLAPPFAYLCANMRMESVREAWQTFQNLSATARQRACSKAERLAADHNPVTRMSWELGQLTPNVTPDGRLLGPPFAEVACVAWVEQRGSSSMRAIVEKLAQARVEDIPGLVLADSVDVSLDEDPTDLEDAFEHVAVAPAPAPRAEVKAAPPVPAPAFSLQPPAAAPKADPAELDKLRSQIADFECELSEARTAQIRSEIGITSAHGETDMHLLRTYRAELRRAYEGGEA